jgi:hypothetical protein
MFIPGYLPPAKVLIFTGITVAGTGPFFMMIRDQSPLPPSKEIWLPLLK